MYVEGSPYLDLPYLDPYESQLVSYWYEVGTVSQAGMGLAPLTWQELTAWADRMFSEDVVEWVKSPTKRWMPIITKQHTLLDYELQIIRQLSQEYCSEYSQASSPSRPCPKELSVAEVDSLANSTAMGNAFLEMFGSPEQRSALVTS